MCKNFWVNQIVCLVLTASYCKTDKSNKTTICTKNAMLSQLYFLKTAITPSLVVKNQYESIFQCVNDSETSIFCQNDTILCLTLKAFDTLVRSRASLQTQCKCKTFVVSTWPGPASNCHMLIESSPYICILLCWLSVYLDRKYRLKGGGQRTSSKNVSRFCKIDNREAATREKMVELCGTMQTNLDFELR